MVVVLFLYLPSPNILDLYKHILIVSDDAKPYSPLLSQLYSSGARAFVSATTLDVSYSDKSALHTLLTTSIIRQDTQRCTPHHYTSPVDRQGQPTASHSAGSSSNGDTSDHQS